MATTTIPDYPRGITFEQVWAALMEDRKRAEEDRERTQKAREEWERERERAREESDREFRKLKKLLKETAKQQKETDRQMKETDRQMKETDRQMKETDRQMKETYKKIGDLGNRFGELAEHLVAPNITKKFNKLGFTFEQVSQNHVIRDAEDRCIAEIDLLLENGDTVMAVEVKSKPNQKDVKDHIKHMEVLRQRADTRNDTRKFQGAIAGAIMSESVRNYAHKTGFYVIEQTGDTVKITIPENFKPREW